MPIDYDKLMAWPIREIEQSYGFKDSILYALGLGFGADPMDADQLKFVYEDGQKVVPTQALVMGYPGFWIKDAGTGIDWKKIVHGEQSMTLHAPLPPAGKVVGRSRMTAIVDKGPKVGALLFSERIVADQATGQKLATLRQTTVARGDGGFGGPSGPVPEPVKLPETAPESSCDIKTAANQALIYRLSGDLNPLHADPAVAKVGGFPRPILHGMSSFGVVCHALLKTLAGYDPARIKRMDARFTAPVFPGETIRTEIWGRSGTVHFRARAVERDVVVLGNGLAEIAA
ncbi:MAG: 3-alpha,7-alpha,12-alpha-trihydroxy-5-beta-cholest-24-enoyl-CoA hydratase [Alphaproteobacteria bacterium]|nr:3-alpha,7-alpha,12-alpha-trihydroxy-5-beta-cholest-24-enoyl-CoA hydratase [Alphaproteobacteria bacterium]